MKRILLVDDETSVHYAFKKFFGSTYFILSAHSLREAREILSEEDIDLLLLDLKLPDGNGLGFLKEIKIKNPELPVIVITAFADTESAIFAMKEGALDYLAKPFDFSHLKELLNKALERPKEVVEETKSSGQNCQVKLVGKSKAILEVSKLIGQVALRDVPVLIEGESGVGKELVARAIHCFSPRKDKPFVAVNCAALPEALIESELFGYEPGAFTSAEKRKLGKFEIAHGGTLFLDEIGDMSLSTQAKLLRVLQDQTFERLGGNQPIKVNVRIMAATNQNLKELINRGLFRADLYHRLNVVTLKIPPLRERKEDIPLLVEYFIQKTNQELGTKVKGITLEALKLLEDYSFPGNVRELENIIKRAVILAKGSYLTPRDLQFENPETFNHFETLVQEVVEEAFRRFTSEVYPQTLKYLEKALVKKALEATNRNQVKASALLGINRLTLRKKLEEYSL